MSLKSIIRDLVPPLAMRVLRPVQQSGGGYISAADTVAAARAAGLSVCEYVERLWRIEGRSASVIERLCRVVGAAVSHVGTLAGFAKEIPA